MGERVRITDVSPRDGLQNEPGVIPTADKVRLVELLTETGVDEIEVTSFVSPKWVPQLGDAAEVMSALRAVKPEGMIFSVLVPNEHGMRAALEVNRAAGYRLIDKISVFTAASETFSKKNTNATIDETLKRFEPVFALVAEAGLAVRGYVSCVIACPFEGPIPPRQVKKVVAHLNGLMNHSDYFWDVPGFASKEIDLGDTIGAGTAGTTRLMLEAALSVAAETGEIDVWDFVFHPHDTFGRAPECVKVALDMGVRSFDGSVAGLGGCPYASTPGKRAPGNISTETLVRTIHAAGYETGVDLDKLEEAAAFARQIVAKARAESGGVA